MRKIVLSAEARQDIKNIGRYTARQWGKDQADKYIEGLREQIRFIQKMPAAGIDRSKELGRPIFSFLVESHVIYYVYNEQRVGVIGILHQAMSPKVHLSLRKTN